ncbi:hypothetical protein BLNAU_4888 [Blattamonas nauphoetae]|uniref:Uncharacterized protein n=1 Tax=Blattamonas nauphoetae TaxID=2049346 RepID=A0ABQ9Y8H0_9EUKA|nr:hypothetical protein BLNAU_4888 [Blattamonas nauphoetae]
MTKNHLFIIAGLGARKLLSVTGDCLSIATPYFVGELGITAAVRQSNHREMVFQKVLLPSSQSMAFLISNRFFLEGDVFGSFMNLLDRFIEICPFHIPTLDFILASPIAMAITSCLTLVEDNYRVWVTFQHIYKSLEDWKKEGPEVVQSGKLMLQALFSEGIEVTLEQMSMNNKHGCFGMSVVNDCLEIPQLMGSNVNDQ